MKKNLTFYQDNGYLSSIKGTLRSVQHIQEEQQEVLLDRIFSMKLKKDFRYGSFPRMVV